MNGKLLITGAGGFLGRHVVGALLERGHAAEQLVTATRGDSRLPAGVETRDVDLSLPDVARSLIAETQPDCVLHLAGAAFVAVSGPAAAEAAWRDNAESTLAVASALRESARHASVLLASSAEVYGRGLVSSSPTTEDCPPAPAGVYGRTKFAAEQILADVIGDGGRSIMLRLFNSAGPGQDERFVISAFAAQIARIEAGLAAPLLRVGNLDPERDFLDVRDTARAWALMAETAGERPPGSSTFNVASGEARAIRSIVEDLARMARRSFTVEPDPARSRASDVPRSCGDSSRLRSAIGWQPRIPWMTTLADTLDHWRSAVARSG
jgi:GDP-4-dehydro-6-deoxy-D-mannose reductase